ncbi:MAG: SANT/Myb-like DNA-binding domain-containing protein [Candidatus Pacebacteria bacterium]|nr:SANT/Myb-like DNA-binding domain-containing protein [Candidatus Paceibacterota bacterium]
MNSQESLKVPTGSASPDARGTATKRGLSIDAGAESDQGKYTAENEPQEKTSALQKRAKINMGPWTPEEHNRFLDALGKFGNNWTKVCEAIGSRSPNQARSHAQKYFNRLRKEEVERVADGTKRKLFAITREFVNRTAVHSSIELVDVPARLPKKKSACVAHKSSLSEESRPIVDNVLRATSL